MTEEEMTEEKMRNEGYSYNYIEGYFEGSYSNIRGKHLDYYLAELRSNGIDSDYIKGYEEGYKEEISDKGRDI